MLHPALLFGARLPGAGDGAVGGRQNQQPAAGLARAHRATGRDRTSACRQFARLAGIEAQGLPARSKLRELGWDEKPPASAIIERSPKRGCRTSCSNISTAVRTTR